jgi:hypothetical protein
MKTIAYVNDKRAKNRTHVIWIFDTKDPMVYSLYIPEDSDDEFSDSVKWDIGRELFREALDERKIGGKCDVLVTPPRNNEVMVAIGNGDESVLLIFDDKPVISFHEKSHKRISADQEIEITMDTLLSKVSA